MKKTYSVQINGCDDSTYVELGLTSPQLKLLQQVACAVNSAATEHCMPKLLVWPVGTQEPEPYTHIDQIPGGAA